ALLLPLVLAWLRPDTAGWDVLLVYFASFLIAGLIAMTYTEFVDEFLLLCVAYPVLWTDPRAPRQVARAELLPLERRLRIYQALSVVIPLAMGLALIAGLLGAGAEQRASSEYQLFLLLVLVLLGLGIGGASLAMLLGG